MLGTHNYVMHHSYFLGIGLFSRKGQLLFSVWRIEPFSAVTVTRPSILLVVYQAITSVTWQLVSVWP